MKTVVGISDFLANISIWKLPNAKEECCHSTTKCDCHLS